MLTQEQIEKNKEEFLALLNTVTRENSDLEELTNELINSDFFSAPASTIYHSAYTGGLCSHSLNVYRRLCQLVYTDYPEDDCPYSKDTLIIVSLLHDISKMNFYEIAERNVKDNNGNWIKTPFIKIKDNLNRLVYGNHEQNSLFIIQNYIPLMIEEQVAILHHMGGKSPECQVDDITAVFNRYNLSVYLHMADFMATFIDERII